MFASIGYNQSNPPNASNHFHPMIFFAPRGALERASGEHRCSETCRGGCPAFAANYTTKVFGKSTSKSGGLSPGLLGVRSNMFPTRHPGEQIGLVERPTSKNVGNRHVVTADRETGIAVNVMRCSDAYIKKHYK